MKIKIYTNETCPYCKQVKEELIKNNIKFENINTQDHIKEWNDIVSFTGIPTVPTLFFGNEYHVPGRDFRDAPNLLIKIKNYKPCSFPVEQQVLEKLKTLNYNMGIAFNRTNQILSQIETKIK
mgnify:CR=1 FL=1|tara:strand:+ start:267 stop:635 length:369 start_codon:yes stop_codon:yes gene_type:complete